MLFSVVILGLLVVAYLLKSDLKANLWNLSSQSKDANDYSGQISKVRDILTSWTGMKAFILSLTGKVYYILVAGFMKMCIRDSVNTLNTLKAGITFLI